MLGLSLRSKPVPEGGQHLTGGRVGEALGNKGEQLAPTVIARQLCRMQQMETGERRCSMCRGVVESGSTSPSLLQISRTRSSVCLNAKRHFAFGNVPTPYSVRRTGGASPSVGLGRRWFLNSTRVRSLVKFIRT